MRAEPGSRRRRPVDRFHRVCVDVVTRLPLGLDSVVAPTFLGFAVINGFTFGVDLVVLTVLHAGLGVPVPVAVSSAYACAFSLSYSLNRNANFQSHAPVGPQLAIYVVVAVVNYLVFVLGVSSVLTALGVDFRVSRILAGCCEAVYMYGAMRWVVSVGTRLTTQRSITVDETPSKRPGRAQRFLSCQFYVRSICQEVAT